MCGLIKGESIVRLDALERFGDLGRGEFDKRQHWESIGGQMRQHGTQGRSALTELISNIIRNIAIFPLPPDPETKVSHLIRG
jgi:hypothetical protein